MANIARFKTAADIINDVAVEIGLNASAAPLSDADPIYNQMKILLTTAGQDLVHLSDWPILQRLTSFTTTVTDTGVYDLPVDFSHMIPQTGWQKSAGIPLEGSLTPQAWEYLRGRGLGSPTIYAAFRESLGQLWLYPQPPPADVEVIFEYVSRGWVYDGAPPQTTGDVVVPVATERFPVSKRRDSIQAAADLVLFEPRLISALLKVRILAARRFDTTKAQDEFDSIFESITSHKTAAPVLSLWPSQIGGLPPLNIPDTGYGT